MIKSLLKLIAILIVGILIYNYFLGSPSEKEGAQKIFKEFKDAGVAVKGLLQSEKAKFDAGKYDKAVNKIGDLLQGLKRNAQEYDGQYLQRIDDLEKRRVELSQQLSEYQQENRSINNSREEFIPKGSQDSSKLKQDLQRLVDETGELVRDMESSN
ncbi:MAG: hypothetical protein EPO28_12805 [Saprospiraceae bacterium]|nr:MAG: hypothetical protein EPO28_12805 [Saprospiraceae bacterium]